MPVVDAFVAGRVPLARRVRVSRIPATKVKALNAAGGWTAPPGHEAWVHTDVATKGFVAKKSSLPRAKVDVLKQGQTAKDWFDKAKAEVKFFGMFYGRVHAQQRRALRRVLERVLAAAGQEELGGARPLKVLADGAPELLRALDRLLHALLLVLA